MDCPRGLAFALVVVAFQSCGDGRIGNELPTCGNGTCEPGESGATCAADCPVACVDEDVATCTGGDGCCPAGCISTTDTDCSAGPDVTAPTIAITSPTDSQSVTTAAITVSGSASDDIALDKIEVKVGTGSFELASGTTAWSKSVTLSVGSNTIFAKATDSSGNQGETSVVVAYRGATLCGNGVLDAGEACDTKGDINCGNSTPVCRYDCEACVATSVVINSDKTISINGKKTFPVGMYYVCSYFLDAPSGEPCSQSLEKNSNFTFSMSGIGGEVGSATWNNLITDMENGGMYWQANANWESSPGWKNVPMSDVDKQHFFGWLLQDEPDLNDVSVSTMRTHYDGIKTKDPNHPVFQNISGDNTHFFSNLKTWQNSADVISWDTYTCFDSQYWPRSDSIYAWEQWSHQNAFDDFADVNEVTKPVWAVLQANGTKFYFLMTAEEVRALTYTAITLDIKGIVYWGYKSYANAPSLPIPNAPGLVNSESQLAIYDKVARELRILNDVLVSPTKSFRWEKYASSDDVTFSKNLTKTVLWATRTNFNYILKQNSTATYLIVVNKDDRSILDVDIAVAGLSGLMTAETLGLETSGSSKAGRTLEVTNGKFTDSFDGYAAHIYQICSGTCPAFPTPRPSPSSDK